jgi:hypothetical protein
MTDDAQDHPIGLPMPDEARPDWRAISGDHWRATSYEDAMQRGLDALRRSYTLPEPGEGDRGILQGQLHGLQAAAWFAFGRELREAKDRPDPVYPVNPAPMPTTDSLNHPRPPE